MSLSAPQKPPISKLHPSEAGWAGQPASSQTKPFFSFTLRGHIRLRSGGTLVGCQASSFVFDQPHWHRSNSIKPFHDIQCEDSFKYTITHRSTSTNYCTYETNVCICAYMCIWVVIALISCMKFNCAVLISNAHTWSERQTKTPNHSNLLNTGHWNTHDSLDAHKQALVWGTGLTHQLLANSLETAGCK